jgi:exosortase A-associated hydrolase 2
MPVPSQALFLTAAPGYSGQRFGLFHPAVSDTERRGAVLYVHPFAEEMNKSRRMAAMQARALAQAGFDVLQIDLLGCGDSSGDFGDASWAAWVADVLHGCQWLRQRNAGPLWLWGLRAGCLLAADAARQLAEPCHFIFWQPPTTGKILLQQFLRLKAAGDLMGGQAKGILQALRDQLAGGESVEIAGYQIAPALVSGLEQATLSPPRKNAQAHSVQWFELSTRQDATLSPVSGQAIAQWQQAGYTVDSHIINGPAFWQTTEIEDAPALISGTTQASLSALASPSHHA